RIAPVVHDGPQTFRRCRMRIWIVLGALLAAAAVGAGAFGAHGLAERLGARELALWETGARYLFYAGLGAVVAALAAPQLAARPSPLAAALLVAGGLIFAGTLFLMALGGPRWLGAITPLGGVLQILGFLVLAWQAWRG